jgi:uncharacterized protein (TIGR03437 family)
MRKRELAGEVAGRDGGRSGAEVGATAAVKSAFMAAAYFDAGWWLRCDNVSKVRYFLLTCAVCCATLSAQIDHLSTTSDGSVLYFSAYMSLKTSNHVPFEQIFRYLDQSGTFEECIDPQLIGHPNDYTSTATSGFGNPDVTADGALVAFEKFLACTSFGSACLYAKYQSPVGIVQTSDFPDGTSVWSQLASIPRISRNGRYIVNSSALGLGTSVISLVDGSAVGFGGRLIPAAAQAVSDDGSVLVNDTGGYALANKNGSHLLRFSQAPTQARLGRDAKHIVYESVPSSTAPAHLFFYDVTTDTETMIATGFAAQTYNAPVFAIPSTGLVSFSPSVVSFSPSLDDSGTRVLYVNAPTPGSAAQMFLWSLGDPLPGRQIATVPEGTGTAVLSGLANVAYAATATNRILRIDVATGGIKELSGRLPIVSSWYASGPVFTTSPGSLVQANGTGLADASRSTTVRLADTEGSVVGATVNQVFFQIPWDFPPPDLSCPKVAVKFGPSSTTVFEQPNVLNLCPKWPHFISDAIHQDFHGFVSQSDPASRDEVVHFYMTGLGPVSPLTQTGEVASNDPLRNAQPPFCDYGVNEYSTDIAFAGLAPGLVGVYQVDVRLAALPATAQPVQVDFYCGAFPGQGGTLTSFYYH